MKHAPKAIEFAAKIAALIILSGHANAQQSGPPQGYFDIPSGFDFPADKQTLEAFRAAGNLSAERTHAWNVFAGFTQPTPDGKYLVFETWYSEDEAFQSGASPQGLAPRRVVRRFTQPAQFRAP